MLTRWNENSQVHETPLELFLYRAQSTKHSVLQISRSIYIKCVYLQGIHGTALIQPWILCLYMPLRTAQNSKEMQNRILPTECSCYPTLSPVSTRRVTTVCANCPVLPLPSPSHFVLFFFLSIFSCLSVTVSLKSLHAGAFFDSFCRWQPCYSLLVLSVLPCRLRHCIEHCCIETPTEPQTASRPGHTAIILISSQLLLLFIHNIPFYFIHRFTQLL